MIKYLYDESFEGLLTCIFYGYKNHKNIENIQPKDIQLDLFSSYNYIETELDKAKRVFDYLTMDFNISFLKSIYYVFLSNHPRKEIVILNTVVLARKYGNNILNVPDDNIFLFNKIKQYVLRENHRFKGLLRFQKIQNGFYYAAFEPENNILPILINHFINRFGNTNFLIHDIKRNYIAIYENGIVDFFEVDELRIEYSSDELEYQNLWKDFYNNIAIKERKNLKQQMNFMPKKYWKHIVEKNDNRNNGGIDEIY